MNFFDDDDLGRRPPGTARPGALANYKSCANGGAAEHRPTPDLDDRSSASNWRTICPTWIFCSALLRHRSETERLKQLNQYLALYIPRQRTVERMKELAPTNGFGGKPAGL